MTTSHKPTSNRENSTTRGNTATPSPTSTEANPISTTPHFIAYFDVLGYKEYLDDDTNSEAELLSSIKQVYERLNALNSKELKVEGLAVKTFSDNVVIAFESKDHDTDIRSFDFLVALLCVIQLMFFEKYDLLIRGGLVCGGLYIDESLVFGKGLVKAVKSEEEEAIYPRIIINDSIEDKLGSSDFNSELIRKDDDGKPFLNYFNAIEYYSEYEPNSKCLDNVQKHLIARIKKHCSFPSRLTDPGKISTKEKTISKHLWMIEKFNSYCKEHNESEHHITYEPKLSRRLMKYYLHVQN